MTKEQELNDARIEAHRAFYAAQDAYDKRLRALHAEARERLSKEPEGIAFFAAQDAYKKADMEWKAEFDRNAEADALERLKAAGLVEGDVVQEWRTSYWASNGGKFQKTKEKGIVQVYRNGDQDAIIRYGVSHGDVIVREIKKDGTPGKRAEKWAPGTWLKEGVPHPKGQP